MRLLRRILRRPCAGRLIADDGLGEVLIGQLQVVLRRNRLAVSDPLADDVHRELLRQFRFPRAAKILERLWPRLQPSLADDPVHVCPQIRANVAVACDDVLSSRLGFLEDLQKMQAQLGKQRDHPARAAIVMLGLRTWHADAPVLPVHVGPGQREHFGRAPQAAKAGKGEDQPPLRIRAGIYHLLRIFAANEVVAVVVCPHRNANALERIGDDQTSAFRRTKELPSAPNGPPDRILGLPFADQVHTEVLSVAERDVAQGQVSREERQQVCSCPIQIDLGARLDVGPSVNIRTGERAEHG